MYRRIMFAVACLALIGAVVASASADVTEVEVGRRKAEVDPWRTAGIGVVGIRLVAIVEIRVGRIVGVDRTTGVEDQDAPAVDAATVVATVIAGHAGKLARSGVEATPSGDCRDQADRGQC